MNSKLTNIGIICWLVIGLLLGAFNIQTVSGQGINNGGFETGDFTGWDIYKSVIYPAEFSISTDSHSGNYAMKGSLDISGECGRIVQIFQVQKDAVFSFYYKANMQSGPLSYYNNYRLLSGWMLYDLTDNKQITTGTYFDKTYEYTLQSFDLAQYAGHEMRFSAGPYSDGQCGKSINYVLYIDDVSITSNDLSPVTVTSPDYQEAFVGENAKFNGSGSYDPDGSIISYEWDFGDGLTGSDITTEHSYDTPGTFMVIFTVTDNENNTVSDSCTVVILEENVPLPNENKPLEVNVETKFQENQPPIAVGTPKTQEIYVGEYAKMDGTSSYDPDGSIVSYKWICGEGTIYHGAMASIKMHKSGTYEIMLTVEDNDGATKTDNITVTVVEWYDEPSEISDEKLPDNPIIPKFNITKKDEPVLLLTAGLINIATFKEGLERTVPVEVAAYYGYVKSVKIELIDDGGLEIEVIPMVQDVPSGRIMRFYLKITVPEFEDNTHSKGITITLKAVGENCESNVEHIDILISSNDNKDDSEIPNAAQTVGTLSGITILALIFKRRFL